MRLLIGLLIISFAAACSSAPAASVPIERGDMLLRNPFDDPLSWDAFGFGSLVLNISDGHYNVAAPGGGYIWALNNQLHSDVEIVATVENLGDNPQTIYGIMCRAHPLDNGIGYYFLISADGRYGMRIGEGNRIRVLVPFTASSAIRTGKAINTIRAVCVGDYLAMYVNDQFVTEERYDWLQEGYAGLAFNTDDGKSLQIAYDEITIYAASRGE